MLFVLHISELMTELQLIVLTVTYVTYVSTWIRHMYLIWQIGSGIEFCQSKPGMQCAICCNVFVASLLCSLVATGCERDC